MHYFVFFAGDIYRLRTIGMLKKLMKSTMKFIVWNLIQFQCNGMIVLKTQWRNVYFDYCVVIPILNLHDSIYKPLFTSVIREDRLTPF